jgi:hypothetical protein
MACETIIALSTDTAQIKADQPLAITSSAIVPGNSIALSILVSITYCLLAHLSTHYQRFYAKSSDNPASAKL